MERLVVIGDTLLDLDQFGSVSRISPDAPVPVVDLEGERARPGGAGLAALLGASSGSDVTLVTRLGADGAGARCAGLLNEAGVEVIDLGSERATPQKIRVWSGGQVVVRLDRDSTEGPVDQRPLDRAIAGRLDHADGVLVSDYGRGTAEHEGLRRLIGAAARSVPVVWDPHPRGGPPLAGAWLATPNGSEACGAARRLDPEVGGNDLRSMSVAARRLVEQWSVRGVAVTMGERGAVMSSGSGAPLVVPAPPARGDACGAGDRFAASAVRALMQGALLSEAVELAVVEASGFVAAGEEPRSIGGPMLVACPPEPEDPATTSDAAHVVERVRRAGGTVVATGGCFDLLHAGHVQLLAQARALGDCLVVCLNSDASVRRLKGPDRPVVPSADRARVLGALAAVDAVVVFDEDTPDRLLDELRPDLFVKGGDYGGVTMSEQAALDAWAGQVVVVPYAPGRSTSRLLEEVFHDA